MAISGVSGTTDIMNSLTNAQIAKETSTSNEFEKQLQEAANTANLSKKTQMTAKDKETYDQKLKKTCQEMESLYINQMFTIMQNTVDKSDFIPNSSAQDMMRSMKTEELSKNISKSGGIGIADVMYKQLSQVEKDKQLAKAQERMEKNKAR